MMELGMDLKRITGMMKETEADCLGGGERLTR